jgi:trk system potassium uptake protein TrkA
VHVVIMGCGRVGSTLAHALEDRGHTVSIIDSNPDAFRRLGPSFNGTKVTGIGFDQGVLERAGVEKADAFAAVSSGDNSNIISARVARETFNVQIVVARIYDYRRAEIYERLGIPTIATVPWAAHRLIQLVLGEAAHEEWRDPSDRLALVSLRMGEGWIGRSLIEIEQSTGTRIAYITRFGLGELPTSSTLLQDGDVLHVMAADAQRARLPDIAAEPPEGA